ncbi:hypothetical protein TNCV_4980141 [Trichonephila clavipes]|nr:hypothetical protein TNCV_4980141 [Trichonephila clavipes]
MFDQKPYKLHPPNLAHVPAEMSKRPLEEKSISFSKRLSISKIPEPQHETPVHFPEPPVQTPELPLDTLKPTLTDYTSFDQHMSVF